MKQLGNAAVLNEKADWKLHGEQIAKWAVASERTDLAEFMRDHGWYMIDRTMQATISLKKTIDFSKLCRIPIELSNDNNNRIFEIAEKSFLLDSRFISKALPEKGDIVQEIRTFTEKMKSFYICRCKEEIAGFLEVVSDEEKNNENAIIRLAAVDERYRISGAALSLYAGVADVCQKQGLRKLLGRISSRNMAVLNLYVALGASFSLPMDIYVRR